MKKIVFTGGHHSSSLAVALELKRQGYGVFWLGHKHTMWGDKSLSGEYRDVTKAKIPFYELRAGKFYRTYNPLKLARIPQGFVEAYRYLKEVRPDLIVSFGGYLAVPVVIVGWFLNIPSLTHEQTAAAGMSNLVISKFARKVFLAFATSRKYFPGKKTEVIGLPLADAFVKRLGKRCFRSKKRLPLVFVTGGKQGSHTINRALLPIVSELLKKYRVVHQTGSSSVYGDFSAAKELRRGLDSRVRNRYKVEDYLSGEAFWKAWFEADLIVTRAGAHSVYQLGLSGHPALLIPIPWVVNNEQEKNAEVLATLGIGEILKEKDMTPLSLLDKINFMMNNIDRYRQNDKTKRLQSPVDAKGRLVGEIKNIIG